MKQTDDGNAPGATGGSLIDRSQSLLATRIQSLAQDLPAHTRLAVAGTNDVGQLAAQIFTELGHAPCVFLDSYAKDDWLNDISIATIPIGIRDYAPDVVFLATLTSSGELLNQLDDAGFSGKVMRLGNDVTHLCANVLHPCSSRSELTSYHDRHRDNVAVIIGNGPSLLKTDPRRLHGLTTFGGNGICLLENFSPTYYVAVDRNARIWGDCIEKLQSTKIVSSLLRDIIPDGIYFPVRFRQSGPLRVGDIFADGLESNFTIGTIMLQLAYYMGCNPVYMIGFDHNYANRTPANGPGIEPDVNHFNPNYHPLSVLRTHLDKERLMRDKTLGFQRVLELYQEAGRQVFDATADGALNVFPKADFKELLAFTST